jgi:integrase
MSAYVYKKKHGARWYIGWKGGDGVPRQKAVWVRTKAEAQRLANELELKAERERLGLESGLTAIRFDEFADRYERDVQKAKRGALVVKSRIKSHLRPFFGKSPLISITPARVQEFIGSRLALMEQGRISLGTVEMLRITLHAMLTHAIRWGYLRPPNPAGLVDKIKVPKKDPTYLEPEEIGALIAATPHQWRNFVRVGMCAGLRLGELVGLKRDAIDLERGTIRVKRSYDRDTTKGGRPRTVAIAEELAPFLAEQLGSHESEWAFPTPAGKMYSPNTRLSSLMAGWAKAAGIEKRVTPKVLRSTYATYAAEQSADLRVVQAMLGHANLQQIEAYAHRRAAKFAAEASRFRVISTDQGLTRAAGGKKKKGRK